MHGRSGIHTSKDDNDLLIIAAGYDHSRIVEWQPKRKDARKKVLLFGFPAISPGMFQENILRAHEAEAAIPSLHGGICGGNEWIAEAEKRHIGWWITSALESNIGLNAIAQWCATFDNPLPQGLGTGQLFTDNVEMPLEVRKDCLWFCNDDI